jgi:hypothetical protein
VQSKFVLKNECAKVDFKFKLYIAGFVKLIVFIFCFEKSKYEFTILYLT